VLIANDRNNNRIYANSGIKYNECFCPDCSEMLIHRVGKHNAPHFAHRPNSNCAYRMDKDSKSPWHIHMQDLFPIESLERRFYDEKTGELQYIADVFLEESNTVIEFQHSPISDEAFANRTLFHNSKGRRIVWVFDESKPDSEYGRLKESEYGFLGDWIHCNCEFDWPRSPRKVLKSILTIKEMDLLPHYSICVYYGEQDTVHRIIRHDMNYTSILFSVHPIVLGADMDVDDFFKPESHWLSQSPYKDRIEEHNRIEKEKKEAANAKASRELWEMVMAASNKRGPRL